MSSPRPLQQIVRRIHAIPELNGCGVYYIGETSSEVLDPGSPDAKCYVVIERIVVRDAGLNNSTSRVAQRSAPVVPGDQVPPIVTNHSRLGSEAIGAGLSCSFAAVSAVAVAGSVAAEVPTAGGSTFLLVIAWGGLITSGASCVNGLARVGTVLYDPDGNQLQRLDENTLYTTTVLINDGLGMALGVTGLGAAGKNLFAVLRRQRSLQALGMGEEALKAHLKGMNRVGRGKVIREAIEEASKTKEGREAIAAAAAAAKVNPNVLKHGGVSVQNAIKMTGAITQETTRRLHSSVFTLLTGGAAVGASASPSTSVGSASGSVNWLINVVAASGE